MRCAPQPISLSAMMDGASASFEDFNPDFMVRCLFTGPIHHQRCLFTGRLSALSVCLCVTLLRVTTLLKRMRCPLSLTGGGRAGAQVFHGRRASQAK